MPRLQPEDVACWVLKSASSPDVVAPGWAPGTERRLERCVRRSYRLDLMTPGRPCLLWVSGRDRPGVYALGQVTAAAVEGAALALAAATSAAATGDTGDTAATGEAP